MYIEEATSRSPKRCTSRNPTGARFLEVQIPPRVLVYSLHEDAWRYLNPSGVLCQALEARKNSVGRIKKTKNEKVKTGNAFPSGELQVEFGNIVALRTLK